MYGKKNINNPKLDLICNKRELHAKKHKIMAQWKKYGGRNAV